MHVSSCAFPKAERACKVAAMNAIGEPLPIDPALPELTSALRAANAAVLVAPPGAGKTTRVPLALAAEPWARGKKLLVLEPRRLAARAAAARMAATLREAVGASVGYRVRFGSKVSASTRIEVVTEGVFTRLVLDDPSLAGVAAVLFDEFHERSLDGDLGLALARDVQQGLRAELKLLVMSATLDGARVGKLLGDAPAIESAGRAFPVETRYLGRDPRLPIEPQVADAVVCALRAEAGSLLVFLPGAAEIRRTEALLRERIGDGAIDIVPLHGALDADMQDRAIAPAPPGRRKVVLATSIAETSLTIEGVRVVIDCGLARVPRYEPDVGLTRLETVRVSRAPPPTNAAAVPGTLSPASAIGCGTSRRPPRSSRPTGRKFSPPIFPASCSTSPIGASPTPRSSRFSICRRRRRWRRQRRCSASFMRSTRRDASPRKGGGCENCRCRRAWRAWWSTRRQRAKPSLPPTSPSSSPSAGSAATTSISAIAWTRCAAIARSAGTTRGGW